VEPGDTAGWARPGTLVWWWDGTASGRRSGTRSWAHRDIPEHTQCGTAVLEHPGKLLWVQSNTSSEEHRDTASEGHHDTAPGIRIQWACKPSGRHPCTLGRRRCRKQSRKRWNKLFGRKSGIPAWEPAGIVCHKLDDIAPEEHLCKFDLGHCGTSSHRQFYNPVHTGRSTSSLRLDDTGSRTWYCTPAHSWWNILPHRQSLGVSLEPACNLPWGLVYIASWVVVGQHRRTEMEVGQELMFDHKMMMKVKDGGQKTF